MSIETEHHGSDRRTLSPGYAIGNYRIVELLGQGGMAAVYRAEHAHVGRQVAIKVLDADYPPERFLAEARAIGSISPHPNVVEVYDCGRTHDGRLYYVMELLAGRDLEQVLGRRALTAVEVLPYLQQICKGLQAAHDAGVVHRDIKLGNIIVIGGETLQLKLFDFGIARLPRGLAGDMNATATGIVIGTPSSMAPEQAAGRPERIGPATDIYAVGVMLYRMLAGRPPFEAEEIAVLLAQHIREEPPPLTEVAPEVPAAVAAVVHRCLEKDPERRFAAATALYQAFFEAAIQGKTATVGTTGPSRQTAAPAAAMATTHLAPDPAQASAAIAASTVGERGAAQQGQESFGELQQIAPPPLRASSRAPLIGGAVTALVVLGAIVLYQSYGRRPPRSSDKRPVVQRRTESPTTAPTPRSRARLGWLEIEAAAGLSCTVEIGDESARPVPLRRSYPDATELNLRVICAGHEAAARHFRISAEERLRLAVRPAADGQLLVGVERVPERTTGVQRLPTEKIRPSVDARPPEPVARARKPASRARRPRRRPASHTVIVTPTPAEEASPAGVAPLGDVLEVRPPEPDAPPAPVVEPAPPPVGQQEAADDEAPGAP